MPDPAPFWALVRQNGCSLRAAERRSRDAAAVRRLWRVDAPTQTAAFSPAVTL